MGGLLNKNACLVTQRIGGRAHQALLNLRLRNRRHRPLLGELAAGAAAHDAGRKLRLRRLHPQPLRQYQQARPEPSHCPPIRATQADF